MGVEKIDFEADEFRKKIEDAALELSKAKDSKSVDVFAFVVLDDMTVTVQSNIYNCHHSVRKFGDKS